MEKVRLGVMGGTFDPIHYGHLLLAEVAREECRLDQVVFIPTACPPHKVKGTITSFWHRYLMVSLAVNSNPCFRASRLEFERGGVSYTVDTIAQLRQELGDEAEIFFIIGIDAFLDIFSWKSPEKLLGMCRFLVAARPGYDFSGMKQMLGERYRDRAEILEMPMLDISSTDIRERVRKGLSIKYLLPEAVEDYIRHNRIYLSGSQAAGSAGILANRLPHTTKET